jgi:hypothetical protein
MIGLPVICGSVTTIGTRVAWTAATKGPLRLSISRRSRSAAA